MIFQGASYDSRGQSMDLFKESGVLAEESGEGNQHTLFQVIFHCSPARGKTASDLRQNKVDFNTKRSTLSFWTSVAHWCIRLTSDLMVTSGSFTLLTVPTIDRPSSEGTVIIAGLRNKK